MSSYPNAFLHPAVRFAGRRALGAALCSLLSLACSVPGSPPLEKVDLLITGGTVLTMDADFTIHDPGFVAVKGDRIIRVGKGSGSDLFEGARTVDASGSLVLPGLINGHQHAAMTLFRGLGSDLKLMDWLTSYIFPEEAKDVDPDLVYWGTLLAVTEMLESGTTTYVDMYYFEDEVAKATSSAGMRGILGQTIIDFPAPDYPTSQETLAATEEFILKWKEHPLITPAVAPHAPYTCSKETLEASSLLARKYNVPLVIHLSETEEEVRQVLEKTGSRPVQYLNDIGFLEDRVIAAHVVWPNEQEIRLLAEHGVGVIHNPESNMKLASGVAPVPQMLAEGIAVGLGTDGPASNNNLDLLQEADTTAKLHKLHTGDPTVLPARQVLELITIGAARAIDREEDLGSLEEGKKGDLVIVGLDEARSIPLYDPYAQLVYSIGGSSVRTVIVNGRIVVEQGRIVTVDREKLWSEVDRLKSRISKSLQEGNPPNPRN